MYRQTVDNLQQTLIIAEQLAITRLKDSCIDFIHTHFETVISTAVMNKLTFASLLSVFQQPHDASENEEKKFLAMTSWVEAGAGKNSSQHIEDLLLTIAKHKLSSDFKLQQLAHNAIIYTNPLLRYSLNIYCYKLLHLFTYRQWLADPVNQDMVRI